MAQPIDIYKGKDLRELPLYSIADAARIVRIKPATIRTWVLGRTYTTRSGDKSWPALIRIADRAAVRVSFANLVELHVLSALRGKHVSVENLRSATAFIRKHMGAQHPLADVDAHTDCVDIYVEYLGRLTNASSEQSALRPIIEHYLTRIGRDEAGLAQRLFPLTRDDLSTPRAIVIDPARRFGRPVIAKANVETATIAERFHAGDSTIVLANDFGVAEVDIEEAVRFETQLRRAA